MPVSGFAAAFLIYGYFLPLVFLFHTISLAVRVLWNGQSLLKVLQDVISIEDDICLLYPPGFLKLHLQSFQDEHSLNDDSFRSDASTADDSDESILSVTQEITCIIPVIIISNDSNDKLSGFALNDDDDTSLLSKYGRDFSNTSASHVMNILRPMPIRSATSITTSDSQRKENMSTDADYSPSSTQFVLTEVTDLVRSTKLVVNSSTTDSCEEISSPHVDCDSISLPSLTSGLSEESDDLDLTEEEEAILETLCIQMSGPDVVPTIEQLAENPHVPANVPVFSRHNISSKVVFPARKPSSPPPAVQCRS